MTGEIKNSPEMDTEKGILFNEGETQTLIEDLETMYSLIQEDLSKFKKLKPVDHDIEKMRFRIGIADKILASMPEGEYRSKCEAIKQKLKALLNIALEREE